MALTGLSVLPSWFWTAYNNQQSHSFNANTGDLVFKLTFTDRTIAIYRMINNP